MTTFKGKQKIKHSYGIGCCRMGSVGKPEILLLRKRSSYSFVTFVFECNHIRDEKKLRALFNTMTHQDKVEITSLDYERLWKRICGDIPKKPPLNEEDKHLDSQNKYLDSQKYSPRTPRTLKYTESKQISPQRTRYTSYRSVPFRNLEGLPPNKKPAGVHPQKAFNMKKIRDNNHSLESWNFYMERKIHFDSMFAQNPNYLHKLISDTKSVNAIWDIPKGRMKPDEKELDTATREFNEEINATCNDYKIMWNMKPIVQSYIADKWKYINKYFLAESADPKWEPHINFFSIEQLTEAQELGWFTIEELRIMEKGSSYHQRLISIAEQILKAYKRAKKELF